MDENILYLYIRVKYVSKMREVNKVKKCKASNYQYYSTLNCAVKSSLTA